jgi:S-formylglutathione hydrolase FrmB
MALRLLCSRSCLPLTRRSSFRLRLVVVAVALGAALAGLSSAVAAAIAHHATVPSLRGTITNSSFRSTALAGVMHYSVYLPPGYAASKKRYPVVYFLHGLPAPPTTYQAIQPIAQAVEESRHAAIVIGVQGARQDEYDPEWLNWGPGRNWETATAKELVSVVDSRYRTIASRAGRLIIGISGGGYGATLIALHNPGTYSVAESWSGYFHATNAAGTAALDLGSGRATDWANAHKLIPDVERLMTAYGPRTYFAFYVGTDDTLFGAENEEFYAELRRAGIRQVVFRVYKGTHNWSLWGAHAAAWVGAGLAAAAKPAA